MFKKAYENANIVLPDGISIVLASRILGIPIKEKCSGADLLEKILEIANLNKKNVFLLGGINGSEQIAVQKLKKIYRDIKIYAYSPPFGFEKNELETAKIIEMINNHKTDILFVLVLLKVKNGFMKI